MFDPESPRVPTSVKELHLRLMVREGDPREYVGSFEFHVLDADGNSISYRQGDLVPELTAGQVTSLKTLLGALLNKAQGVVPSATDMAAALTVLAADATAEIVK